jgi:GTP-binding protein HflX
LRTRLDKVGRQRAQSRRKRQRSMAQTVALVGYTNAGKSTLFNRLTGSEVDTRDMQFATLDPTVRQLTERGGGTVLLADTVGFVSELPPELVAAFRATLQEAREADLLLHVIDASDPYCSERREEDEEVLETIGAGDIPSIRVYNKIDRAGRVVEVQRDAAGLQERVSVSALEGLGMEELLDAIKAKLSGGRVRRWIELSPADGRLRAQLFENGAVTDEELSSGGAWRLQVDLSRDMAEQLARQGGQAGRVARALLLGPDPARERESAA